jgi:hypothetical protein
MGSWHFCLPAERVVEIKLMFEHDHFLGERNGLSVSVSPGNY